jgi:hypothetical protein
MLALLPSPLLGPAVWEPAAGRLIRRGWHVATIPGLPRAPTCAQDAVDAYVAALPADRELVLVPHSNAGLLAPLVAHARTVVGYVFVDARLPPMSGVVPVAEPAQLARLAELADEDGVLPPWTAWWDPADAGALFPDDVVRDRVERQQQRLPLSYFADPLQIPVGWDDRPSAYLSFGDTYARERADAATRGWPVRRLPGEHLHMLMAPDVVAEAIEQLLAQNGITPGD